MLPKFAPIFLTPSTVQLMVEMEIIPMPGEPLAQIRSYQPRIA